MKSLLGYVGLRLDTAVVETFCRLKFPGLNDLVGYTFYMMANSIANEYVLNYH